MSTYFLCIDTALSNCSVAIFQNFNLLAFENDIATNTASEKINLLIDDAIKKANIELSTINAIVVSAGPGSYTGLRISAAIAKGISYALSIPIIAISTLEIMYQKAKLQFPNYKYYLPCIDARRDEIYFSLYDRDSKLIEDRPQILNDQFEDIFIQANIYLIFGNASEKVKTFLNASEKINSFLIEYANIYYANNFVYDAKDFVNLANLYFSQKIFADTAYFEPNYTKPFFLQKKG